MVHSPRASTLRANEDERNIDEIPVMIHFTVVLMHGFEAVFVLEAKDENDCIKPMCKLDEREREREKLKNIKRTK